MKSNGKFELNAVIVLYACSDGKLRPVEFVGKNAKQIHGYITHIHGGEVRLRDEEALVVNDTKAVRAAMDALECPKPTLRSLIADWLKRNIFGSAKRHAAYAVNIPSNEDHSVSAPKSKKIEVAQC